MGRMRAQQNIDRLFWLKRGRTFDEIISPNSPYRIMPNNEKGSPISSLHWDINQGRVIQAANNKYIIKI